MSKKVVISLFLVSFFFVAFLAMGATEEDTFAPKEGSNSRYSEINNIKKIIGEKTPEFLSKPIIATVTFLENFRRDTSAETDSKFVSFIFDNLVVFYAIFIFFVLIVLRSLWRLVFG